MSNLVPDESFAPKPLEPGASLGLDNPKGRVGEVSSQDIARNCQCVLSVKPLARVQIAECAGRHCMLRFSRAQHTRDRLEVAIKQKGQAYSTPADHLPGGVVGPHCALLHRKLLVRVVSPVQCQHNVVPYRTVVE